MQNETSNDTTCGARRPGWENGPAIGIHRIPCVLSPDHQGDHANAFGQQWPREHVTRVCCRCYATGPDVTAVGAVERISGPAWTAYACPVCAPSVRVLLGE